MFKPTFAAVLLALSLPLWAQSTPVGLWRTVDDKSGEPRGEVRILATATGVLSGRVERALVTDPEPNCSQCTDDRKGKPKVGLEIIRGGQKTEGQDLWEGGKILDPENGKEYTLRLSPLEGGKKLQVRGYIGPFYRTQIWQRIE
jgi:uncharacterized protein (DUF2147 family)